MAPKRGTEKYFRDNFFLGGGLLSTTPLVHRGDVWGLEPGHGERRSVSLYRGFGGGAPSEGPGVPFDHP